MIVAVEFDELAAGDQRSSITAFFDLQAEIAASVNDERRYTDRRQHNSHIDL